MREDKQTEGDSGNGGPRFQGRRGCATGFIIHPVLVASGTYQRK